MVSRLNTIASAVALLACARAQVVPPVFTLQTFSGACIRISGASSHDGRAATKEFPCGHYENYQFVNQEIRNTNTNGMQIYCLQNAGDDFSVYWKPVQESTPGNTVTDTCTKWNYNIVGDGVHFLIKTAQFCINWFPDPMVTRECIAGDTHDWWSFIIPPSPSPSPKSQAQILLDGIEAIRDNGIIQPSPSPTPVVVVAPVTQPGQTQPQFQGYAIINRATLTCIDRGAQIPGTSMYTTTLSSNCNTFEAVPGPGPNNGILASFVNPTYCLYYTSQRKLEWVPCAVSRTIWETTNFLKFGSQCYDFTTQLFERCNGSPGQQIEYSLVK